MRRLLLALGLVALAFAVAPQAQAADCDAIASRTTGTYTVESFFLLDSDTADATGTLCDLNTWGNPDFLRFSVRTATGCASGYQIRVNGRDASGGLTSEVGFLADNRTVGVAEAPLPRHVQAVSNNLSGCTDLDVVGEAYYRNDATTPAVSGLRQEVIFCGQADENGTIFLGPATGPFGGDGSDISIGSTGCDALDNATEATADAPIFTDLAFGVQALFCETDGTLGAGESVIFTMRSAEADTSPVQTCTVSQAENECSVLVPTDTDVAAGATVAVEAVQSSDNADDNLWCRAVLAVR